MKTMITFLLFSAISIVAWTQNTFSWPVKELDTARDVSYLSDEEKDMILEINKVRYNPAMYATERMKWLGIFYEGKFLKVPGMTAIQTDEGKAAYEECLKFLETAKPAPVLYPSKGMSKACKLLIYDQETTGQTGHKGASNTSPADRAKKFGVFMGNYAENIHYGEGDSKFSVIALLIDDGVKNRGHRLTILNPSFNYTGVATGKHKIFSNMFVSTFASNYTDK